MCVTRLLFVVALSGLCIGGCANEKRDAARPSPERKPRRESPPVGDPARGANPATPEVNSTQPAATDSAATQPERDGRSSAAAGSQPAAIPDYVLVLERFSDDKPYAVDVRVEDAQRVTLRTTNVKRLQIRRAGSGLSETRSVAILIDQQGIEWKPSIDAVELERSINGAWRPVERK